MCGESKAFSVREQRGTEAVSRVEQVAAVRALRDSVADSAQRKVARAIVAGGGNVFGWIENLARIERVKGLSYHSIYGIIRRHDANKKAKRLADA